VGFWFRVPASKNSKCYEVIEEFGVWSLGLVVSGFGFLVGGNHGGHGGGCYLKFIVWVIWCLESGTWCLILPRYSLDKPMVLNEMLKDLE